MKNSDYQVIILAAGESKRLKELTPEKPKFFLEINNKKIIEYHFDALSERGFKEATLVVGFKKELVMETFRDKYKNINIDYVVGELIGINKFSSEFFEKFYDYLKEFVEKNGKGFNYEVILNEFIKKTGMPLHYVTSDGLAWMNINYKEDYLIAKEELYNKIYGN